MERESEIVAQSGRRGAVTIATNMAGRGTDILLGGNPGGRAARACTAYPVVSALNVPFHTRRVFYQPWAAGVATDGDGNSCCTVLWL